MSTGIEVGASTEEERMLRVRVGVRACGPATWGNGNAGASSTSQACVFTHTHSPDCAKKATAVETDSLQLC